MNILIKNKIANCGLTILKDDYNISDNSTENEGILVRSALIEQTDLSSSLLAIARAGAGVNNIPIDDCSKKGIVVFNTPGANANAVKELVIAGLFLSSRKITDAVEWVKTLNKEDDVEKLIEKEKNRFVGPELHGKTIGVIGLGAIGVLVANAAKDLGMNVLGYDPYVSVDAAWGLSRATHHASDLNQIYEECDYITIHVPLNDSTHHLINEEALKKMKDGVRILNFARAQLVDTQAMLDAIDSKKVACYAVDFPTAEIIGKDGIIAIPHLGASTPESEDNCAVMAATQLKDYLENGNIKNSVNYPPVLMPTLFKTRICVLHKNIPNMLAQISSIVSNEKINIDTMINRAKGNFAYTVLDVEENVSDTLMHNIQNVDGVIKVRIISKNI